MGPRPTNADAFEDLTLHLDGAMMTPNSLTTDATQPGETFQHSTRMCLSNDDMNGIFRWLFFQSNFTMSTQIPLDFFI